MVRLFPLCCLSLGLLNLAAETARADEAFLCGPDTVVYVAAGELEIKKRTDPCVASHFGLTVDTVSPRADNGAVPEPAKAPEADTHKASGASKGTLPLKALEPPERADPVSVREERSAALIVGSVPGTDYRNIRILNASSPDAQWFRHKR